MYTVERSFSAVESIREPKQIPSILTLSKRTLSMVSGRLFFSCGVKRSERSQDEAHLFENRLFRKIEAIATRDVFTF